MAKSYHPATAENLALLRKLCEESGQRYSAPRTNEQAQGRIRDLRAAKRPARPKPPLGQRKQKRTDFEQAKRLMGKLKIVHYAHAKRAAQGPVGVRAEKQYQHDAAALERRIDRLLGVDA